MLICAGTGITVFAGVGGGARLVGERGARSMGGFLNRIVNHSVWDWHENDGDHSYDYEDHEYDDHDDHNYDDYVYSDEGMTLSEEDMPDMPKISKDGMTLAATYDGVTGLKVSASHARVKVVENPQLNNQTAIYVREKKNSGVRHKTEGGELEIDYYSEINKQSYVEGIVEIPAGYTFRLAELDAEAGTIEAERINAEELELSADAGCIRAAGDASKRLKAEADAATVEFTSDGKKEDFNYEIEENVGTVQIGGESYTGMFVEKTIDNKAAKTAKLESDAGAVKINFR